MSKIFTKILIIFSLVVVIGGTLTFAMTWRNLGFGDDFLLSWLTSFALCVLCIAPIGGIISLLLNKGLTAILPNISAIRMNILFGLCMAIIMETIMAAVTTVNLYGFDDVNHFIYLWIASLLAALPIGIMFSIIMSLIVKPKLTLFWVK